MVLKLFCQQRGRRSVCACCPIMFAGDEKKGEQDHGLYTPKDAQSRGISHLGRQLTSQLLSVGDVTNSPHITVFSLRVGVSVKHTTRWYVMPRFHEMVNMLLATGVSQTHRFRPGAAYFTTRPLQTYQTKRPTCIGVGLRPKRRFGRRMSEQRRPGVHHNAWR